MDVAPAMRWKSGDCGAKRGWDEARNRVSRASVRRKAQSARRKCRGEARLVQQGRRTRAQTEMSLEDTFVKHRWRRLLNFFFPEIMNTTAIVMETLLNPVITDPTRQQFNAHVNVELYPLNSIFHSATTHTYDTLLTRHTCGLALLPFASGFRR